MIRFEEELKKNNFVCSECMNCKHLVWPPSDFCNKCFGNVTWRSISRCAKLIEVSSVNGKHFCVAEFEGNIRVFGTVKVKSIPYVGQNLILEYCNYDISPKFVFLAD
jgi:uncharacterized OB-fold protein